MCVFARMSVTHKCVYEDENIVKSWYIYMTTAQNVDTRNILNRTRRTHLRTSVMAPILIPFHQFGDCSIAVIIITIDAHSKAADEANRTDFHVQM